MHQIQFTLDDDHYRRAKKRADEAGYGTVEQFAKEVLTGELDAEIDQRIFFTPERLAEIDSADADIEAGNFYTSEQVDLELKKRFGI